MTRGKEGSQLGFHGTCSGGRDEYGDCLSRHFLRSRWWKQKSIVPDIADTETSGLEVLVPIVLKQEEHYFCVMPGGEGIEGFGS